MTPAQFQAISNLLAPAEHVMATSRPRPRLPVYHLAAVALAATLAGMLLGEGVSDAASLIRKIVPLIVPLGVVAFAVCWGAHLGAEMRAEERAVGTAEDALRTDRLDVAVHVLTTITSTAMQSSSNRVRALWVYIGALLDLKRFDDVIKASGTLLAEGVPSDLAGPLWSAMAYALLREDRLVDAGRAIHELRKIARGKENALAAAMLVVVEMYRDVGSGHPDEVLEAHAKKRDEVAAALGYRVSDADALTALAAHLRQNSDLAAVLWQRATLLQPGEDLIARYPQLQSLSGYPAGQQFTDLVRATGGAA